MGRWAARLAELLAEKSAAHAGTATDETDGTPFRQLWQCPARCVAAEFVPDVPAAAPAVDAPGAATESPAAGLRPLSPPADDPIPSGGREVLSLLDMGAMTPDELARGLAWRRGEALGLLLRLRALGAVRQAGDRWRLTAAAERFALSGNPLGDPTQQPANASRTTRTVHAPGRTLEASADGDAA